MGGVCIWIGGPDGPDGDHNKRGTGARIDRAPEFVSIRCC